jgi:hypothetical protein
MDLKLKPESGAVEMLHQLRDDKTISSDHIKVEPHQTYIYELEQPVNESN